MKAIVFSEKEDLAAQILTMLRGKFNMDLFTTSSSDLTKYGAQNVFYIKGNNVFVDNISDTIKEHFKSGGYDLIIIGSSVLGRELSSILSEDLGLEAKTEIMSLEEKNGSFVTERFFYGGKSIIKEESKSKIFTVLPGLVDPVPVDSKSSVNEINLQKGSKIRLVESIEKPKGNVNLEKAEIIVSVGRGLGKKEGLSLIQQLADTVHGEIGGSRPVCLDYHWLSEERQVGLSGKRVKPKIYIALGISGQVQHIAGMRGSKIVIAVNRDKNAPIFNECDYGVVGDLYSVVPKIIDALKKS